LFGNTPALAVGGGFTAFVLIKAVCTDEFVIAATEWV
jgi:hypothetical protein